MALPRSLKVSIAIIICLTIFVFSFLGLSIHNMSENTIEDIGTAYMDGMNEQVSLHFETIIALRLTMAESIAHIAADKENSSYGSKEDIEYGARARHFLCAGLYSSDGRIEMIYGDPVEPSRPEPFLESLKSGIRCLQQRRQSDFVRRSLPISHVRRKRQPCYCCGAFCQIYERDPLP